MRRRVLLAIAAAVLSGALLLSGCAGAKAPTGALPESASLAPADALAYASLTTNEGSDQWKKADRLLGLFPGARDSLLDAIRGALSGEGLTWEGDVAPALGPEVVVVATAERKPIVLTKPDDPAKLAALLAQQDTETVIGEVSGWTAVAERQAELDAYRASLSKGTLATVDSFAEAMDGLPQEALARVWVNGAAFAAGGGEADPLEAFGLGLQGIDLGIDSLSAAVAAEEDGLLLSVAVKAPKAAGGTRYTLELVNRVPGDAVAALSFGGSQGTFDKLRGTLGEISDGIESAVGVSLDRVFDALSGEGVLYVREGSETMPEVTLVLSPPDADRAFATIDELVRKLAEEEGATVQTRHDGDLDVSEVETEGVILQYAMLDADTVIVTTGPNGIRDFRSTGEKLTATDGYTRAAKRVGLTELTRGFLYVDIDGVIPLVESLAGPDALPPDAREVLGKLDSFILQADGDGSVTRLTGFVAVTG